MKTTPSESPKPRPFREAFRNRSMRFLLIHNWWLAIANGITQTAFFLYMITPVEKSGLAIGLGTFYVLSGVMRLVKIPVSALTGWITDRRGHRWPMFWGVIVASFAMPFWLLATPSQWWWIFGAYVMWGAFATVNIAGQNLALTLSPRSDNAAHLSLFRQIGGLLAGLSGLLGGLWLTALRGNQFGFDIRGYTFGAFQLLFAISWFGRLTAAFWLLPIREGHRSQFQETSEFTKIS